MGKGKKPNKRNKNRTRSTASSSQASQPQDPPQSQAPPFTPISFDLSEFIEQGLGPAPLTLTMDDIIAGFNEIVDEFWDADDSKKADKGKKHDKIEKKSSQPKGKKKFDNIEKENSKSKGKEVMSLPELPPTPTTFPDADDIAAVTSTLVQSSPAVVAEPSRYLVSRTLPTDSIFPVYDRGYSPYDMHVLMDADKSDRYVVHGFDKMNKSILTCVQFDYTLVDWLAGKTDPHSHWDSLYDFWNSTDNRKLNKVDTVSSWDCRRLAEDTRLVIQSMLKAVMELHSRGQFHGFLYNPENYVFSKGIEHRRGIRSVFLACTLIYENTGQNHGCQAEMSIENDMMHLSELIFDFILAGNDLTRELKHLRGLMSDFCQLKTNRCLIVDHPSLWFWERRFSFYELIWMKIHKCKEQLLKDARDVFKLFETNNQGNEDNQFNRESGVISDSIISLLATLGDVRGWHTNLPKDSLLNRIRGDRFVGEDSYTILAFLRVVHFPYLDKRLTDDSSSEDYYVLKSESKDFFYDKYLDVLTSESFPLYLVRVYAGLCSIGVFL